MLSEKIYYNANTQPEGSKYKFIFLIGYLDGMIEVH